MKFSRQSQHDTRRIDIAIPLEGTSENVHLQILPRDITTEATQAVVVFRAKDGMAKGASLRVLQAAGQSVDASFSALRGHNWMLLSHRP